MTSNVQSKGEFAFLVVTPQDFILVKAGEEQTVIQCLISKGVSGLQLQ